MVVNLKTSKNINFKDLMKTGGKHGRLVLVTDTDLDGGGESVLIETNESEIPYHVSRENVHYLNAYTIDNGLPAILDDLKKEDFLFITDVTPDETNKELVNRLNEMHKDGHSIVLLDHHKSALWLNEYDWADVIVQDENNVLTCGTSLFAQFLEDVGVNLSKFDKEFVELVRLWDTWDWTRTNPQRVDAKQLSDLFGLYKDIRFRNTMLQAKENNSQKFVLPKAAQKRLNLEQEIIDEAFKHANKCLHKKVWVLNNRSYVIGVCFQSFKGTYGSEIGNRICNENTDIEFVAMIDVNNKKVSLRSTNPSVDLSQIAKLFDGGGHAPAAGCSLTKELLESFSVFDDYAIINK